MRRPVNLRLNDLPPCRKCGGKKTVIRTPGRITVYCPNCDDMTPKRRFCEDCGGDNRICDCSMKKP